jgi:Helix-turn-helix of DDE superfamily endonuclease
MCQIVQNVEDEKISGRESDLSIENQLMLTLNYRREYRSMLRSGQDLGLHESNVSRTIKKIENICINY